MKANEDANWHAYQMCIQQIEFEPFAQMLRRRLRWPKQLSFKNNFWTASLKSHFCRRFSSEP
ncbi:unnamed protein product [Symbiodinium pilosum]|uniref:Uncharacterized protein n=1 Tax=Symbiodinium pilosum TaxID=2952 RepID=A0A812PMD7_SYMPI|nr:unnamed protein product [Symbiodinium pilosum]